MAENKLTKYLLYAIGEIVLVVIGILIALQINNNNVKRQASKLEQEYLLALVSEFEINLNKIDKSIEGADNLNMSLNKALTYFDVAILDTLSDTDFGRTLYEISGGHFNRFEPVKAVMSDIINSGKLGIIQNQNLRQSIASFNSDMELLKKQFDATDSSQQEIQEFIKENGSIRALLRLLSPIYNQTSISDKIDNKNVFKSTKFENYIFDLLLSNRVLSEDYYPRIKKSIEGILEEVHRDVKDES